MSDTLGREIDELNDGAADVGEVATALLLVADVIEGEGE